MLICFCNFDLEFYTYQLNPQLKCAYVSSTVTNVIFISRFTKLM